MSKRNVAILLAGIVVLALCCGCIDEPVTTPVTTTNTVKTPAAAEGFPINYPIAATFFIGSDWMVMVLGESGIVLFEDSDGNMECGYWEFETAHNNMRKYRVTDEDFETGILYVYRSGKVTATFEDVVMKGTWE